MDNSQYWSHLFINGKWHLAAKLEPDIYDNHEPSGMRLTVAQIHQGWSIAQRSGMWVKVFKLPVK